jgi:hypothetical protein
LSFSSIYCSYNCRTDREYKRFSSGMRHHLLGYKFRHQVSSAAVFSETVMFFAKLELWCILESKSLLTYTVRSESSRTEFFTALSSRSRLNYVVETLSDKSAK